MPSIENHALFKVLQMKENLNNAMQTYPQCGCHISPDLELQFMVEKWFLLAHMPAFQV